MPRPPSPSGPRLTDAVKLPTRSSSLPGIRPAGAETGCLPPPPRLALSNMSVLLATAQPAPSPPMTFSCGTRASSRNTSLKSARPVISLSGRTSIPGCCISMAK